MGLRHNAKEGAVAMFLAKLCNLLARLFAADRAFGATRSPKWAKVRKAHLAAHPSCAACGRTDGLEVHHVLPFHLAPERELDPDNLITLCDPPCHLLLGHLRCWSSFNKDVREDAARLLAKIKTRPE